MDRSQPLLPSNHAFVVQFRARSTDAPPSWEGRVEHLTSGQALRFQSLDALQAFMIRVLTDVDDEQQARRAGG